MDYNLISTFNFDGGQIYQGGSVDIGGIRELTRLSWGHPVILICMDKGEYNEQFINHPYIGGVLSIWIDDNPDAVLTDEAMLAHVTAGLSYLRGNHSLYIHCGAGVSRSSYYDIALHMALNGWTYDQAFAYVHSKRNIAQPNPGFEAHLRKLEPKLKALLH